MAAPEDRDERRGPDGPTGSASEQAYRTLLRAYPEDLRGEYGEEMARAFRDLRRRELERRGALGLAALWARALPELVFTALKERSSMLARNAHLLPSLPTTVARWGAASALVGGVLGMAYYLTWAVLETSVVGDPAYYLSGPFLDLFSVAGFFAALLLCVFGLFGVYGVVVARSGDAGGLAGAGAGLCGVAAACALGAGGYDVAKGLAAWPSPGSAGYQGWEIALTQALALGSMGAWIFALLLLGAAAHRRGLPARLRALPFAVAALWPASFAMSALLLPDNYGLNGYGVGNPWFNLVSTLSSMLPFLGSALLGLVLLRDNGAAEGAVPAAVAGGGAAGGGSISRRMRRVVPSRSVGGTRASRGDAPATEAAKEKEILEALRRRRELAVAGAALETSLTVEEADRMLSALAAKGHLEVRVERGRLLYSLWEGDG